MATVDVTIPTQKQRKEASSLHDEGQEQSKSCCKEGSFPREDEGLIVTLVTLQPRHPILSRNPAFPGASGCLERHGMSQTGPSTALSSAGDLT